MRNLLLLMLFLLALPGYAQNQPKPVETHEGWGKIHRINISPNEGGLADTPKKMVEHLKNHSLITDADLEGSNVFSEVVVLYMPSLFGKKPNRRYALYVPPELREQIKEGVLIRFDEGTWTGLMGTRVRIAREILNPELYPTVNAECENAYEVYRCIRDKLKEATK
jgi:hypothetical protein